MENLMEIVKEVKLQSIAHVADETTERASAVELHCRIMRDGEAAAIAHVNFAVSLKEMRDSRLYKELGFCEFGDYTKEALGIMERQAYNYISNLERLGIQFLQSNAKMGVTKLQLLAAASTEQREIILEENDVENMSVRELKEALEEVEKLKQQLTFFENQEKEASSTVTVVQQPMDEVKAEIEEELRAELESEYQDRIAELEAQAAESKEEGITEEELQKYKANAEKEAKAIAAADVKKAKEESAEELKKLKADLKAAKDAQKTKDEAIKKAEEAKKVAEEKAKQGEDALKRAAELEAKVKTAEAEKEEVEKQIKLSSDPELTRFKFIFEEWQRCGNDLAEQLGKLDEDKQTKMRAAVNAVMEGLGL